MNKLVVAVVITAFASLQIGSTLDCYNCLKESNNCKEPSTISCNQQNADETTRFMEKDFDNVPDTKSDNFNCLAIIYRHFSDTPNISYPIVEYKGCIYAELDPCFTINASQPLSYKICNKCGTNRCNSAGGFSYSGFTVLATLLGAFMLKILAFTS